HFDLLGDFDVFVFLCVPIPIGDRRLAEGANGGEARAFDAIALRKHRERLEGVVAGAKNEHVIFHRGRNISAIRSAVSSGTPSFRFVSATTARCCSGKRTTALRKPIVSPKCETTRRPRCSPMNQPKPYRMPARSVCIAGTSA